MASTQTPEQFILDPAPRPAGAPRSIAEAAAFLGLCRATVERACRAGRIKATRFGRRVVISDDEVRRIVAEGF